MFKKILVISMLSYLFLFAPICSAENTKTELEKQLNAAAGEKGAGFSKAVDPRDTISTIIKSALMLLGFIFVVLALYAGFLWMTASGDDSKIEKAKGIFSASTIGLIIIISAYGITTLIVNYILTTSTPVTPIGQ